MGRSRPPARARRPGRARGLGLRGGAPAVAPPRLDRAASIHAEGRPMHGPHSPLSPGQASDPRRHGVRAARRAAGFEAVWQAESRLVREATVPMAAYAAVTDRIGDRLAASSTTGRATSASSPRRSRRSTTSRPAGSSSGIGAWWDPLAAKVGIHRRQHAAGDARDGRGDAPPARDGARHLPRRVRRTSTTSRSTSSTATARRSTCRSTSARRR